ncbi:MAG: class I SAM-dependent methyltransferase [Thermoleophilia bacterium]|nr:class I SAM-dependent methyltransferase [Thermoleophilia bacterium]
MRPRGGAQPYGSRDRPAGVRTPRDPSYLRDLFSRSARFYDRVNVLTSVGQVARWRKETVALAAPRPSDRVLDAFSGPGGLGERALPYLGHGGGLVLVDLSPVMLHEACRRVSLRLPALVADRPRIAYVPGDILRQDMDLGIFDVVLLGWGLRYVPDVPAALARLRSFLRPGGRLALLEFTRPAGRGWALPAHLYFRKVVPALGARLAGDCELHDYLHVSSAAFLDADALSAALERSGFRVVAQRSRLGGLVTTIVATPATSGREGMGAPIRG